MRDERYVIKAVCERAGWKLIRVFISSPFKDMREERDYLVRFVFPKLRLDLIKWRVHLLDIDLRWGVTDEQDSLGVCNKIIDECRPRFISILGENYGTIVEGRDKSYTELEIEHSLNGRPLGERSDEYRFFYFRDPDVLDSMPKEDLYKSGLMNNDILGKLMLNILKDEIRCRDFIPRIYPARWDKNLKRLVDLEVFGSYVYADLLWSVIDELGEEAPEKMDEFGAENAAMEAFAEERSSRFIPGSRKGLLEEMRSFAEGEGSANVLAVFGEPGSGKSALLSSFYLDYKKTHDKDLVIGHFVGASFRSADLDGTLRRLCYEIGSEGDLPEDLSMLVNRFGELLNSATRGSRVILVLDGINQMTEAFSPQEMRWLPKCLPIKLRIIVSSADKSIIDNLQTRKDVKVLQSLEPLTEEDRRSIIEEFLDRYKKSMVDPQIDLLINKGEGGNPLYLLISLEELRTLGTRSEMDQCLNDLPGDVQSLFRWILKERLPSYQGFRDTEGFMVGDTLLRDYVSCIAVSKNGLTEDELVDLVDPGDCRGNVAALQRLLRPYLMFREDRLDFYHDQLREAAKELYLDSEESRLIYHKKLADYFRKVPATRIDRLVEEYPYQLVQSQDYNSLAETLSNLGLFSLAWRQGRKYEWMGYWRKLTSIDFRYNPNILYPLACLNEEGNRTISKNGWLYYVLGWYLMETEIYRADKEGNYDSALMMFYRSLSIHERILGSDHPSLAEALNGISIIYSILDKWGDALKILDRVLHLRINSLGTNNPKIAATLNNMGALHYKLGDLEMALNKFNNAFNIYSNFSDTVYAGLADTCSNIGSIYRDRLMLKEALDKYQDALKIMDRFFELYSPNKAIVLGNLGDIYFNLGDYKEAEDCYSRALNISENPPYDNRSEDFQKKVETVRAIIRSSTP